MPSIQVNSRLLITLDFKAKRCGGFA